MPFGARTSSDLYSKNAISRSLAASAAEISVTTGGIFNARVENSRFFPAFNLD